MFLDPVSAEVIRGEFVLQGIIAKHVLFIV